MRAAGLLVVVLLAVNLNFSPHLRAESFSQATGQVGDSGDAKVSSQTVRDVAVTNVQASSLSVLQGEVVTIHVTIQNLGSSTETFSLFLKDDTDGKDITSVALTLDSGQSLTVGLSWGTRGASGGSHIVTAYVSLGGDQNSTNDSQSISSAVDVMLSSIVLGDGSGLNKPDAFFGSALQASNINTQNTPIVNWFIGGHDAANESGLGLPAVSTTPSPHISIYVTNADATFQPTAALQDPFQQGEVRGEVHLEGLQSSSGAYIEAGNTTHFVNASGSFSFLVPNGTYDLQISAPGYVPVRFPNTVINPGEVLNIPELTLPFGDANGDGRIDILDLSMAAGNFGATVTEMSVP